MSDTLAKTPNSSDLLDTARRVTRHLADPEWADGLATHSNGEAPLIVASWNDMLGDVLSRVDEVGMPATLVLPRGDEGLWRFYVKKSVVHEAFATEFEPDVSLREFIPYVLERESVHVRLTSAEVEMRIAA